MRLAHFSLSLAILCLAGIPSLRAQDEKLGERQVRTSWVISEIDLLAESAKDSSEETNPALIRTVSSGDLIIKQRLVPLKAAKLLTPLVNKKGKQLAAAGDELYGLSSGSGAVYCLAKTPTINPLGALLIGAVIKALCFKDMDQDGVFDGQFNKKIQRFALPVISGKHSKKLKPVSGGSYEPLDPKKMKRQYFVGVEYEGKPLLYARRNFRIVFGDAKSKDQLSNWFYTEGKNYPQTKSVLGGKFTVLSEKDGDLDIRIDQPLKEQPFSVRLTVRLR